MKPQELMRLALAAGFNVRPGRDGPLDIWATDDSFNRLAELLTPDVALAEAYRCGWEAGCVATRDAALNLNMPLRDRE